MRECVVCGFPAFGRTEHAEWCEDIGRLNASVSNAPLPQHVRQKALQLYASGMSTAAVSIEMGVSQQWVWNVAHASGIGRSRSEAQGVRVGRMLAARDAHVGDVVREVERAR